MLGGGAILDGKDDMGENGAGRLEGKVTALAWCFCSTDGVFDWKGVEEDRGEGMQEREGTDSSWSPPPTSLVIGTNKVPAWQPPSLPPQVSLKSALKGERGGWDPTPSSYTGYNF
ncbi:hypothetical protein PPACK8108_LOCUS5101 [Phakopsora pachyrhizi]|uniref:Uncharacterized protein n=1 Tax=Phakopsora pachyrhizi TaxID=170000 RepID=A0AAV0AQ83_PHAPC|nr:hypothetical protein PPACK8108_LOCUS5101 [Phakopsora pachyrhizi]